MRGALGWLSFAFGYLACYFLSTALPARLLWYYPLENRFRLEVRPAGLAMDFYGRVLLCLLCGGGALVLCRLVLRRFPALGRGQAVHGLLAWVGGVLLFTAGLYVFLLLHRVPQALPLPEGYVPR